jgi:serine/threonine protein kinase
MNSEDRAANDRSVLNKWGNWSELSTASVVAQVVAVCFVHLGWLMTNFSIASSRFAADSASLLQLAAIVTAMSLFAVAFTTKRSSDSEVGTLERVSNIVSIYMVVLIGSMSVVCYLVTLSSERRPAVRAFAAITPPIGTGLLLAVIAYQAFRHRLSIDGPKRGQIVHGWLIIGPLGEGSSAATFRVVKGKLQGVLKFYRPGDATKQSNTELMMFGRLRSIQSAYLPVLLDPLPLASSPLRESGGQPVMVFQYAPGQNLALTSAKGPLSMLFAADLLGSLATAVRDLAKIGIIHRDINPKNVLITSDGPRLIDLGSAEIVEKGIPSFILGQRKSEFIAPEVRQTGHTLESDLYSVAQCVLFAANLTRAQLPDTRVGNLLRGLTDSFANQRPSLDDILNCLDGAEDANWDKCVDGEEPLVMPDRTTPLLRRVTVSAACLGLIAGMFVPSPAEATEPTPSKPTPESVSTSTSVPASTQPSAIKSPKIEPPEPDQAQVVSEAPPQVSTVDLGDTTDIVCALTTASLAAENPTGQERSHPRCAAILQSPDGSWQLAPGYTNISATKKFMVIARLGLEAFTG